MEMAEQFAVTAHGVDFYVEVAEENAGTVGPIGIDTRLSFDGVADTIRAIGTSLTDAWEAVKPDEATVEFGLDLTAKSGRLSGLVVEGDGAASLRVRLTCTAPRPRPSDAMADVVDEELRRYVVRIDGEDGTPLASGFFVAPGWVLTCAHVVAGRATVLAHSAALGYTYAGTVQASPRPCADDASGLWPFPDLALVRLGEGPEHPTAPIDPTRPAGIAQRRDCHTWGYAVRDGERYPQGSPASFRYQGDEGDGWLALKADGARPGLSGAPLICPEQRAVIGVMSGTRHPTQPNGGWATPIWALTATSNSGEDTLAGHADEVLALNRAQALADRASWHAVLPVPETDEIQERLRNWTEYRKGRNPSPSDLLLPEFGIAPYLFRGKALADFENWCETPDRLAIAAASGPGGSGKTRFGVEVCRRMSDRGWVAGELKLSGSAAPELIGAVARLPLPRLLVIDYCEDIPSDELVGLLDRLRVKATSLAPVRVLLLNRVYAGAERNVNATLDRLKGESGATLKLVLNDAEDASNATEDLTDEQRLELLQESVRRMSHAWDTEPIPSPLPATSIDTQALAVMIQAALTVLTRGARRDVHGAAHRFWGEGVFQRILEHEEKYWRSTTPNGLNRAAQAACVAAATLFGAADQQEFENIVRRLPDLDGTPELLKETCRWIGDLYHGDEFANPLHPDRLGEALVSRRLLQDDETNPHRLTSRSLPGMLLACTPAQLEQAFRVLHRCAADPAADTSLVASFLAAEHTAMVDHVSSLVDGRSGPVTVGASGPAHALSTLFLQQFDHLVAINAAKQSGRSDLADSLHRLADLAAVTGDRPRARRLHEEALNIRDLLCERDPGNDRYQQRLAESLGRLADIARSTQERSAAHELHQRALTICQSLVKSHPEKTVHVQDLAYFWGRLADLAWDDGDRGTAHKLHRKALRLRETLAASDAHPIHQRDLTDSLERLADLAQDTGDSGTAYELHQRALHLRKILAARFPDHTVHRQNLAYSLARLGDLAQHTGDRNAAYELHQRALDLNEALADRYPDNSDHQQDLAISLNRLGALSFRLEYIGTEAVTAGDSGAAERFYVRSLSIREDLAARYPESTSHRQAIAFTLNRMGELAEAAGDPVTARRRYLRALASSETLAAADPDNLLHKGACSTAMYLLGNLTLISGNAATAREYLERSLALADEIGERDPDNLDGHVQRTNAMAALAEACRATNPDLAVELLQRVADLRTAQSLEDPGREDLAVDLAIATFRLGKVRADDPEAVLRHVTGSLSPFEDREQLTEFGTAVLGLVRDWARDRTPTHEDR